MGSLSAPATTTTTAGRVIVNSDTDQILVYDASNLVRIIIGILPDGTYGMVVSKTGIDARTAFAFA